MLNKLTYKLINCIVHIFSQMLSDITQGTSFTKRPLPYKCVSLKRTYTNYLSWLLPNDFLALTKQQYLDCVIL